MSAVPELIYFGGRGLAETIRITLTAAGIKFNEVDLTTRDQFLELCPELPFKQVPLLRIDGLNIVQSAAIVRYLGRKYNFFGSTDLETVQIDQLYEGARECYYPFATLGGFTRDDEAQMVIVNKNLDKYLPIYNQILADNKTGYLVGADLTLADIAFFEIVQAAIDFCGNQRLSDFPEVVKFYSVVSSLPNIQRYLSEIRKPRNTPTYVATVKKVLSSP